MGAAREFCQARRLLFIMGGGNLPYRSILFVCDANTFRSPMAELLLKRMLLNLGLDGEIQVRSGGISGHARDGATISLDAQLVLKDDGISCPEDFRSRDIDRHRELVAEADLILTMTEKQKERIQRLEEAEGKDVWVMMEFAGAQGDIADPEGYAEAHYKKCKKQIVDCLNKAMVRIISGRLEHCHEECGFS